MKSNLDGMRNLILGLLDIIFPPFCEVCCVRLQTDEQVVCRQCWDSLEPTHLGNWMDKVTHKDGFDCAFTGWYFDKSFQSIIHGLKYKEKRVIAQELGRRLAKMFAQEIETMGVDAIVPVPLHPAKLRHRGFNQSDLIAEAISSELGIRFAPKVLRRQKNTMSQTTLSSEERRNNVAEAFVARNFSHDERVLLIDDVLTTGATLSACARALREKGSQFIAVLTAGTPYLEAEELRQD